MEGYSSVPTLHASLRIGSYGRRKSFREPGPEVAQFTETGPELSMDCRPRDRRRFGQRVQPPGKPHV
jgi:hypothetical protein